MTNSDKYTSLLYPDDPTKLPKAPPKLAPHILDLFSLKGKVCAITGVARSTGIGYVVAEAYAQVGADLAIIDYNEPLEAAEALRAEFPNQRIKSYSCNVADSKNVEDVIKQVDTDFGTIDVFVANAGVVWSTGSILDEQNSNDKDWHKVMNVDLSGVYYCCKNVGQIFKREGKGSLVITASMSGVLVNVPNFQMPYNAAKAGCIQMAKSLAVEFAPFGARVNSVSPGYMDTGLSDFCPEDVLLTWYKMTPLGRQGSPRELCGIYLYLASDASTFTTGSNMIIDGGITAP